MAPSVEIPRNRRMTEADRSEDYIPSSSRYGTITYSPQYSDENYVYRHIVVPPKMFREVNSLVADRANKLLTLDEVVGQLKIPMSSDWVHYLTYTKGHTLLFKRNRRKM